MNDYFYTDVVKYGSWCVPWMILKTKGTASECSGATKSLQYGKTEEIRIADPNFNDSAGITGKYSIQRPYICVYENAKLLNSDDPLCLTAGGYPLKEVARSLPFDLLLQIKKTCKEFGIRETAMEIFLPSISSLEPHLRLNHIVPFTRRKPHINYYHWITEMLPRLRGVELYAERWGSAPDLLIESNPPTWIEELLELAGYPRHRTIEWTSNYATIDRLVLPKYTRKANPEPYEPSKDDLKWVKKRLGSSIRWDERSSPKRLFISREDADIRGLENRERVLELLSEFGFTSIVPSEYSVAEQIKLFQSANIIVGPHGAGLTNILFTNDATVVELSPKDYSPAYFYVISQLFDLEHHHISGSKMCPDFSVDLKKIRSVILEITT